MLLTRAARIFLLLENGTTVSKIDKKISPTTNHSSIQRIINKFEAGGLVYFQREGREKQIYLTDKGKLIRKHMILIK